MFIHLLYLQHEYYMPLQFHPPRFDHPSNISWKETNTLKTFIFFYLPMNVKIANKTLAYSVLKNTLFYRYNALNIRNQYKYWNRHAFRMSLMLQHSDESHFSETQWKCVLCSSLSPVSIPLRTSLPECPAGFHVALCSNELVLIYLHILRCPFLSPHRNASFYTAKEQH